MPAGRRHQDDAAREARLTADALAPSGAVPGLPQVARPYQGQRAGVVSRVLAACVNAALLGVALVVLYGAYAGLLFVARPTGFHLPTVSVPAVLAAGAVVGGGYLTLAWAGTGRTYGDHLLGLRVVSARGGRLHLGLAAVRAAFCLVVPLGLAWCAVSRSNRSLQDVVLRTSVVYDWTESRGPR